MSDLNPGAVFILLVVLAFSLSVHEMAHAWTANRLGDPTARLEGRLTLNPASHVDVIGTILFPLIGLLSGFPLIGWAKPVPVSVRNLERPRRDMILVAGAGPASNIVLATLIWMGARFFVGPISALGGTSLADPLLFAVVYGLQVNVALAVFNLIPIPPLDGGNILSNLLPPRQSYTFDTVVRPYGFIILYALMLTGVLRLIMLPPISFFLSLFPL